MNAEDIFIFSRKPVFQTIRSTSNLVEPSFDAFFELATKAYHAGTLIQGGNVQAFESALAKAHGTDFCVSFCNGLWGMVLAIKALALPNKTEVIMPAMTYRRLADIPAWLNLTPHFCDVDPELLGPTPEAAEACLNERTALMLIAQPIVKVCDMPAFEQLAKKYDIPVLFDSVEAGMGTCRGRRIGSFGEAECFSMHASKLINGFEAGYITTNNDELANRLRLLRENGLCKSGSVAELGLNARLNEIHAAMGLVGLKELGHQIELNRERYKAYRNGLVKIKGVSIVEYDETEERAYKNFLMKLEDDWPFTRDETIRLMHQDNMLARPYYYPPLHTKKTDYKTISGPIEHADVVSLQYILMPSGDFVSLEDIQMITDYLNTLRVNASRIISKIRQ